MNPHTIFENSRLGRTRRNESILVQSKMPFGNPGEEALNFGAVGCSHNPSDRASPMDWSDFEETFSMNDMDLNPFRRDFPDTDWPWMPIYNPEASIDRFCENSYDCGVHRTYEAESYPASDEEFYLYDPPQERNLQSNVQAKVSNSPYSKMPSYVMERSPSISTLGFDHFQSSKSVSNIPSTSIKETKLNGRKGMTLCLRTLVRHLLAGSGWIMSSSINKTKVTRLLKELIGHELCCRMDIEYFLNLMRLHNKGSGEEEFYKYILTLVMHYHVGISVTKEDVELYISRVRQGPYRLSARFRTALGRHQWPPCLPSEEIMQSLDCYREGERVNDTGSKKRFRNDSSGSSFMSMMDLSKDLNDEMILSPGRSSN